MYDIYSRFSSAHLRPGTWRCVDLRLEQEVQPALFRRLAVLQLRHHRSLLFDAQQVPSERRQQQCQQQQQLDHKNKQENTAINSAGSSGTARPSHDHQIKHNSENENIRNNSYNSETKNNTHKNSSKSQNQNNSNGDKQTPSPPPPLTPPKYYCSTYRVKHCRASTQRESISSAVLNHSAALRRLSRVAYACPLQEQNIIINKSISAEDHEPHETHHKSKGFCTKADQK